MAPAVTVRLVEEKRLDRQIDYCRYGARKDNARVIIERKLPSRNPDAPDRRIPILEVTPAGDLVEIAAPTLKTSLADCFPASMQQAAADRRRTRQNKRRAA